MKRISDLNIQAQGLCVFDMRSMRHPAHNNTKTNVVVPVVGIVPVAPRTTQIPAFIVVRTATQHARDSASQPRRIAPAPIL